MAKQFNIDELPFYVYALSQSWPSMPNGFDGENGHEELFDLAPNHQQFPQATPETIDTMIENELKEDAQHQQTYWLWIDRAIEAIGMLEADGFDLGRRGKLFASKYYSEHRKNSRQNAFISLVKPNLDVYENQLRQSNIAYEMGPADPNQDAQTVADVNDYNAQILSMNNYETVKDSVLHDFAAFGSGVWKVDYRPDKANPDSTFFEKRIRDGEVIDFEEYVQHRQMMKAHVIDYVDTFELIRYRGAAGRDSWNINHPIHPYVHRVRNIRVAEAKKMFPQVANRIRPMISDVYRETNPKSFVLDNNESDQVSIKSSYIRFPVAYDLTYKVRLSNGDVVERFHHKPRSAVLRVDRLEGVGVVDMELDRYAHNMLPFATCVNYPSVKHSCGVGLCKYGYAPQKVHSIMFNGKLRFFERGLKGGGWFYKGVIDDNELKERQKEHTWIGIDPKELPPELANRPIRDLVAPNDNIQFPVIYDRLEGQAENYVNTTMSIPPPKKGFRGGTSGRQDLALIDQADQSASSGIRAFEAAQLPLGRMVHSNIVQFDGERYNIEFLGNSNEVPGDTRRVVLNEVIHEELTYDPFAPGDNIWDKWKLLPTLIKNNLKTLQYTTRVASRSIIPTNPTERRFFMQEFISRITPLTQDKKGLITLKHLVQSGFGGIPGFDLMIEEIQQAIEEDRQFQMQIAQAQNRQEQQQAQFERQARMEELRQNLMEIGNDRRKVQGDQLLELLDLMIEGRQGEPPVDAERLLNRGRSNAAAIQ